MQNKRFLGLMAAGWKKGLTGNNEKAKYLIKNGENSLNIYLMCLLLPPPLCLLDSMRNSIVVQIPNPDPNIEKNNHILIPVEI